MRDLGTVLQSVKRVLLALRAVATNPAPDTSNKKTFVLQRVDFVSTQVFVKGKGE
jgi:hypothetical protein